MPRAWPMNLIDLSIKRPVFAWILMSALIIFGAVGLPEDPLEERLLSIEGIKEMKSTARQDIYACLLVIARRFD